MLASIADDTGWWLSTITAAFSTGLVVSALAGIPVGRIWTGTARGGDDRGSVLGGPAVALALPRRRLVPRGLAAGRLAKAGSLYPPAFAALTRWWGRRRVRR